MISATVPGATSTSASPPAALFAAAKSRTVTAATSQPYVRARGSPVLSTLT